MSAVPTLISHRLCPYVQRVAIVLAEKGMPFKRIDVDLANKPDWFLKISPLGKTPVLVVGDQAIFESSVICEYLEDTASPRMHPQDALERAQHRGWMEFGSSILNAIGGLYNAANDAVLAVKVEEIRGKFEQLEAALGHGPYFAGSRFSIVDAVFGPVFRYFDAFETFEDFGFFRSLPKLQAWRAAVEVRPSVRSAAGPQYPMHLREFLLARKSALSARIAQRHAANDDQACQNDIRPVPLPATI